MSAQLVLVINSGSSSLKYQIINTSEDSVVLKGQIERIGSTQTPDHLHALNQMLSHFEQAGISVSEIEVVGHRVVHGGQKYSDAVLLTDDIESALEDLNPLAPLHNPANLAGIKVLRRLLPSVPQVAVFDTAFHSTIPEHASTYAISTKVSEEFGIRKYGFHGTSNSYVARTAAQLMKCSEEESNFIICHIGNGVSITAIHKGKSVDTSMGFTPLEGLVMGTRSGDIDPGILFHLARVGGYSVEQMEDLLVRESGLLGLTGNHDMREVRVSGQAGDEVALKALAVYSYRIRKYIASYLGVVPAVKAVIFTAGVGENDPDLRSEVIRPLRHLGLELDSEANFATTKTDREISSQSSRIQVWVIGTNEEVEIANQAVKVVSQSK